MPLNHKVFSNSNELVCATSINLSLDQHTPTYADHNFILKVGGRIPTQIRGQSIHVLGFGITSGGWQAPPAKARPFDKYPNLAKGVVNNPKKDSLAGI